MVRARSQEYQPSCVMRPQRAQRTTYGCKLYRIPLCKDGPCWQEHVDRLNSKEYGAIYNIHQYLNIFVTSFKSSSDAAERLAAYICTLYDWCARSTFYRTLLSVQGMSLVKRRSSCNQRQTREVPFTYPRSGQWTIRSISHNSSRIDSAALKPPSPIILVVLDRLQELSRCVQSRETAIGKYGGECNSQ